MSAPTILPPNPELLLSDITAKIQTRLNADTALVGIHSGGVWMMQRILENLGEMPHGTLDAALYRDDYAQRGLKSAPKPSDIPFDVQSK
ncbi:MAG: bifunctional pyr operon transcriptional regulator/uracil phosphoribosyltransferase PyrR, partial [Methylophilaceae bacterium]